MSEGSEDYPIDYYINNAKSCISKLSDPENESDASLNKFLQEKYEKSAFSPYRTGQTISEALENSYSRLDSKENFISKQNSTILNTKFIEKQSSDQCQAKIYSLESRINELTRIQDSLMKTLEENKILALRNEQKDKRLIDELKARLAKSFETEEISKNEIREKKNKQIKDLENSREELKRENTNLLNKLHGFSKDLKFIEIHSKTMTDELKSLKTLNSALQSEIVGLKAYKIENLKQIDHISSQLNLKDQTISELNTQIISLESRISDLKALIQSTSITKMHDLSFKANNSNLSKFQAKENQEFQALGSQRPLNQKKVDSIEKTIDFMNLSSTVFKKKRSKTHEKKISSATSAKIIRELMIETAADDPYHLIEIIKKASRDNKVFSKSAKFVGKVKDLVLKFISAPASKNFTLKKLWKYIKRLFEEYFELKELYNTSQDSIKALSHIKDLVGVETENDICQYINKLLIESQYLNHLLSKTKIVMRLSNKTTLNDLEAELDKRL